MADNIPPNDADITDELASIVQRVSDLVQLATTGPFNSRAPNKIAKRLFEMDKHIEAKEFQTLVARAEELRSTSSDPS